MKYRPLGKDDVIQEGDLYGTDYEARNSSLRSAYTINHLGERAEPWVNFMEKWYRPAKHNWISFRDRRPTKEDADAGNRILARDYDGCPSLYRWDFEFMTCTHWIPLNFHEDKPSPIKVDNKEIIPQKDGSVKLSCGTTIPKSDVQEFIRQYQEIVK